jgi:hypothetical protein
LKSVFFLIINAHISASDIAKIVGGWGFATDPIAALSALFTPPRSPGWVWEKCNCGGEGGECTYGRVRQWRSRGERRRKWKENELQGRRGRKREGT